MTDTQIDLGALALLLPDTVKRKILTKLEAPSEQSEKLINHENAQKVQIRGQLQQFQQSQTAANVARPISCISSRALLLPSLEAGACTIDGVLRLEESQQVLAAVKSWLASHGQRPGMGTASSGGRWHDTIYRGDITSWTTPQELKAAGQPLLAAVLDMMTSIRQQLTKQGFDVSGRCSIQLACYPGGGARYVRHTDASDAVPGRTVTALLYLNPDWDVQMDGGQLALYGAVPHTCCCDTSSSSDGGSESCAGTPVAVNCKAAGYDCGEPALLVAPLAGRLLVFDSRLPHEVLPAQRHRYSITVFFYKSKVASEALQAQGATAGSDPASAAAGDTCSTAETATVGRVAAPAGSNATAPAAAQQISGATATLANASEPAPVATSAAIEMVQSCSAAAAGGPLPRIFVSIAAFRDEECQWTLRDLFLKATHPGRVFVGVVWQVDPHADAASTRMAGGERTAQYRPQVREVRLHYQAATGPCKARSLAQQLWAGEEFILQIDAHMRFVPGWDELCLQQLHQAQSGAASERIVLSTYPLGYSGRGPAAVLPEQAPATLLCAKGFDASGMLHIQGRSLRVEPPAPLPSWFWAAGFSFAPSAWLLEVPYCPHLPHLFFGEESYMLARMVTRGWQVYAPSKAVVFHQWDRSARASSYQACVQVDMHARAASQAKVLQLLQQSCDGPATFPGHSGTVMTSVLLAHAPCDADWAPGGVWGLGTAMTLQQYEDKCGVWFKNRVVDDRALYGGQDTVAFME